ncbi:MAG: hypothetical protein Q7S39_12705, partial [Ignavibacteria bacterium]|nr:hypothetical protein [Ignavibacteria bacterium]
FLSYKSLPALLYIRSKDGDAKRISIYPQRVFSKGFKVFAQLMYLLGIVFTLYWIIRAIIFISRNIFN